MAPTPPAPTATTPMSITEVVERVEVAVAQLVDGPGLGVPPLVDLWSSPMRTFSASAAARGQPAPPRRGSAACPAPGRTPTSLGLVRHLLHRRVVDDGASSRL